MLIGELSKRMGFSHDTIRFYEKKGLIHLNKKERRENNYKDYPEAVYERLVLIKTVKALGFTLHEANEFIQGWEQESASCRNLVGHLTEKINRIEEQIKLLQEIKAKLAGSVEKCLADNCEFEKMVSGCIPLTIER
jgi:DNA-binding transcriptional MerR regulator